MQDTNPLILKCRNGEYLIEIEPLLAQLFWEGSTKPSDLFRNKLLRNTPNQIELAYICDRIKNTEYSFQIVDYQFRENGAEIEDKLTKDMALICLNMSENLVIDKRGGRKGLKFITEKAWNAIKYKGDFFSEKCQVRVKRFDAYFGFVIDSLKIETPPKNNSHQQ